MCVSRVCTDTFEVYLERRNFHILSSLCRFSTQSQNSLISCADKGRIGESIYPSLSTIANVHVYVHRYASSLGTPIIFIKSMKSSLITYEAHTIILLPKKTLRMSRDATPTAYVNLLNQLPALVKTKVSKVRKLTGSKVLEATGVKKYYV